MVDLASGRRGEGRTKRVKTGKGEGGIKKGISNF